MTLKSLAHPDWPYAGSPHEWRGFVKDDTSSFQALDRGEGEFFEKLCDAPKGSFKGIYSGTPIFEVAALGLDKIEGPVYADRIKGKLTFRDWEHWDKADQDNWQTVYQKQNFGPELK